MLATLAASNARANIADVTANFADITVAPWVWALTGAVIVGLLVADLLIVHRRPHVISFREAGIESAVWITIGVSFTAVVAFGFGGAAAGEYLSGYLIEKSLSVDNVFVWAVIFSYFAVPAAYQFRVLFWGVFGALVLRAIFVFAGVALLDAFGWLLYIFGAFLIFTAWRLITHDDDELHPEENPVFRLVRRVVPSIPEYDGQRLFVRRGHKLLATPLFAVLVLVETTDVLFAVDSIPAILAVSREPYLVLTSNAFAILGLRSLYFLLAGMADRFRFLNYGLAAILAFVGVKMLIAEIFHIPTWASLVIIALILVVTIVVSLRSDREHGRPQPRTERDDLPKTPANDGELTDDPLR